MGTESHPFFPILSIAAFEPHSGIEQLRQNTMVHKAEILTLWPCMESLPVTTVKHYSSFFKKNKTNKKNTTFYCLVHYVILDWASWCKWQRAEGCGEVVIIGWESLHKVW